MFIELLYNLQMKHCIITVKLSSQIVNITINKEKFMDYGKMFALDDHFITILKFRSCAFFSLCQSLTVVDYRSTEEQNLCIFKLLSYILFTIRDVSRW